VAGVLLDEPSTLMKTRVLLITALFGVGLVTSAFAARGGGNGRAPSGQIQRGGSNNPDCVPKRDGSGPQQNPNRLPKRDGTGGPNKPANPDCPQDGSGRGPGG
jgi:hypothetical protein